MSTITEPRTGALSTEDLAKIDAYWRAANYLSVGQICLYDNPLLKEPLTTLKVRVVNVVDLMTLQPPREHPHGLSDADFDVIERVPGLGTRTAYLKQMLHEELIEHREDITRHGDDMPEVRDWTWDDGGVRNDGGRTQVL